MYELYLIVDGQRTLVATDIPMRFHFDGCTISGENDVKLS